MSEGRIDGRSVTCRKWQTIEGKRTSCGKPKKHEGPCSWETVLMTDGSPWRDTGPYDDIAQAMQQFMHWSVGLPMSASDAARVKLLEAAMLAGIVPTQFEQSYIDEALTDPVLATILHGWLLRGAHPYLLRQHGALNKTVDKDTEGQ